MLRFDASMTAQRFQLRIKTTVRYIGGRQQKSAKLLDTNFARLGKWNIF